MADSAVGDSAAHRGVAPGDRSARQRACSARRSVSAASARSSSGWVPALELRDVRVLDAGHRVRCALPRVFAALSPRSLLALEPRFAQLLIEARASMVRRDKSGRIHVAGLDLGEARKAPADDDAARRLVLPPARVRVRAAHRALDRRGARCAAARARRCRARAAQRPARARRPPRRDAARRLGRPLQRARPLHQPLFSRPSDWRRWSGTLYADLPRAELAQLQPPRRPAVRAERRRRVALRCGWTSRTTTGAGRGGRAAERRRRAPARRRRAPRHRARRRAPRPRSARSGRRLGLGASTSVSRRPTASPGPRATCARRGSDCSAA